MNMGEIDTTDLDRKVFEKMGWKEGCATPDGMGPMVWYLGSNPPTKILDELPAISSTWEICTEYLVPFMRGKGFEYRILNYPDILGLGFFWVGQVELAEERQWKKSKIINDNIARAACEAFLEVEV